MTEAAGSLGTPTETTALELELTVAAGGELQVGEGRVDLEEIVVEGNRGGVGVGSFKPAIFDVFDVVSARV